MKGNEMYTIKKRKIGKEIIVGFVSLLFIISSIGMVVKAEEDFSVEEQLGAIIEEQWLEYQNDPVFDKEAEILGLSFEQLLREKATKTLSIRMQLNSDNNISLCDMGNNGQFLSAIYTNEDVTFYKFV